MQSQYDKQWAEKRLRKMMYVQKRSEERKRFAENRRVSESGIVYVLIKRRAK